LWNPEVLARVHERQRATTALLAANGVHSLAGLDVIEIGCGNGANLLEFLQLGAEPGRLVGNELLPDRLAEARRRLPEAVRLYPGDASALTFGASSFDIVYQSTVFSSVLDDALQADVAAAMWRWLRPGGAVLWYDFTVGNPRNPDVRGVPLRRIRALFPDGRLRGRRLTLAPPLARRVVRLHPGLYTVFNALPLLRTHLLCWIQKP
jgi:ubiquinone/menaquinone biosynthesis C-methylase UbiE